LIVFLSVFLDGTWLWHSLVVGRGQARNDPLTKLGKYKSSARIDWSELPTVIRRDLEKQLREMEHPRPYVEVVRTLAFTSAKMEDEDHTNSNNNNNNIRTDLIQDFRKSKFDVHV
jgi:hypothetical protein